MKVPELFHIFPEKYYHLRAICLAEFKADSAATTCPAESFESLLILMNPHYQENDHGQRTTAQNQRSKKTQEATGTRQNLR